MHGHCLRRVHGDHAGSILAPGRGTATSLASRLNPRGAFTDDGISTPALRTATLKRGKTRMPGAASGRSQEMRIFLAGCAGRPGPDLHSGSGRSARLVRCGRRVLDCGGRAAAFPGACSDAPVCGTPPDPKRWRCHRSPQAPANDGWREGDIRKRPSAAGSFTEKLAGRTRNRGYRRQAPDDAADSLPHHGRSPDMRLPDFFALAVCRFLAFPSLRHATTESIPLPGSAVLPYDAPSK